MAFVSKIARVALLLSTGVAVAKQPGKDSVNPGMGGAGGGGSGGAGGGAHTSGTPNRPSGNPGNRPSGNPAPPPAGGGGGGANGADWFAAVQALPQPQCKACMQEANEHFAAFNQPESFIWQMKRAMVVQCLQRKNCEVPPGGAADPCEQYMSWMNEKINYVGPHPPCDICRDGDHPSKTSMVINFLYIGEGSCDQYFTYGKEGRIQNHMCDPVKFFAHEPCGCGEFNPYFHCIPGNGGSGPGVATMNRPSSNSSFVPE